MELNQGGRFGTGPLEEVNEARVIKRLRRFTWARRVRADPLERHAAGGEPSRQVGAKLGIQVTAAESAHAPLDLGADYLACQGTHAPPKTAAAPIPDHWPASQMGQAEVRLLI
jgi:hypothetical protein